MSQTTNKPFPELRNPSVRLVLEETERNASLRHQAKAATAGVEGQSAIVKVNDRRLSGLERAKRFIEWDKARAFRDDLRSLSGTINPGPAPAAPALNRPLPSSLHMPDLIRLRRLGNCSLLS